MTVHIVAGGQFGSEGKGAFTAALVRKLRSRCAYLVRVGGPNAGHTAYDSNRRKWSLRQIPVGAVVDLEAQIIIGQGSEIDPKVLQEEITELEKAGIPIRDRLRVDLNATVIDTRHKNLEAGIDTGTTGKGIGGARAERILRKADRVLRKVERGGLGVLGVSDVSIADTAKLLRAAAQSHTTDIIIEGTQGYGLGLHTGFYPYTTSCDCRPGDFLAMTGIQPWGEVAGIQPWLVFRAHPIRIAGNSGPLQHELSWEDLGQPVEFTTVTKKPRRVGQWNSDLAHDALEAAGGPGGMAIAFMFLDYMLSETTGVTDAEALPEVGRQLIAAIEHESFKEPVRIDYVGTSPETGVWRPVKGWV